MQNTEGFPDQILGLESSGPLLLAGIDEAGYGSLLGPLTVSLVRFNYSEPSQINELLTSLESLGMGQDSKSVFRGKSKFRKLELAALALRTAQLGVMPRTIAEYLGHVPVEVEHHPWYCCHSACLPMWCSVAEIDSAARLLSAAVSASGVSTGLAETCARLEGELNASYREVPNKAAVHLRHIGCAIQRALEFAGSGVLRCDRLGNRKEYADWLGALGTWTISTVLETKDLSSYEVLRPENVLNAHFEVGADKNYTVVALASCLAKYGRELFIRQLNKHFCSLADSLAETRGYPEDGLRFLLELRPIVGLAICEKLRRIR